MTFIRGGGAATRAAFSLVIGAALVALPGCTGTTDTKDPAPQVDRFPGEPWEPQEQAQKRLARALEDLLGSALPGATLSPYASMPGATGAPLSAPLTFYGDRLEYTTIVVITDPAGRAMLFAQVGPKGTEQECLSPPRENVPATDPPAAPQSERRPDGTVLFGEEYLSKDGKTASFVQAGAYLPDHTCVRFDLQNMDMSGDQSKSEPTRKGGLPLGRTALADIAADPSLTVFPPGFEEPK